LSDKKFQYLKVEPFIFSWCFGLSILRQAQGDQLRLVQLSTSSNETKKSRAMYLVEAQNMILFTFFILCASFWVLQKAGDCRRSTAWLPPISTTFSSNYKTLNFKTHIFFNVYFSVSYLAIFDFLFKLKKVSVKLNNSLKSFITLDLKILFIFFYRTLVAKFVWFPLLSFL